MVRTTILNDYAEQNDVLNRWSTRELGRAAIPTIATLSLAGLTTWVHDGYLGKRVQLALIVASIVVAAGTLFVLGVEPPHHSFGEFIRLRIRWLTRQPTMLHARSHDNVEQPQNNYPRLRKAARTIPGVRRYAGPLVAEESEQSTLDWLPVEKPYPGRAAVGLDDKSAIAIIKVEPANLSTATADQWDDRIRKLDENLSTTVDFEFEQVSTRRGLDNKSYRDAYRKMCDERPERDRLKGMEKLRRDLLDERRGLIEVDHETVFVREDYIVVKVMPFELAETYDEGSGIFGDITNLPFFGDRFAGRRLNKYVDNEDEFKNDLLETLDRRAANIVEALEGVNDLGAYRLGLTEMTRTLMSFYGKEDVHHLDHDALHSLIDKGPIVGADADVMDDTEIEVLGKDANEWKAENYRALIAPERVDDDDQRYLTFTDSAGEHSYGLVMWVDNWPDNPQDGMFRDVLNEPDVHLTLATHAFGMSSNKAERQARSEKVKAEAEYERKTEEGHWLADKYRRKFEAARDMEQALEKSGSGFFIASTYVFIRAGDPDDLLEIAQKIKRRLREQPASCETLGAHFEQSTAVHSCAPLAYDTLNKSTPMLGTALAKQLPYSNSGIYEPSGVEFGVHHVRNEPLIVDLWNRQMGSNWLVAGKIGSGKSTLAKRISMQANERNPDMNLVFIDPLEGLAGPNYAFEGERIPVGGGVGLNPFDISPTPDDVLRRIGRETPFTQWLERSLSFIGSYYAIEGFDLSEKKGVWARALVAAAKEKGITENPNTHHNDAPTPREVIKELVKISATPEEYFGGTIDSILDELDVETSDVTSQLAKKRKETAERILNEDIEHFDENGKYAHLAGETDFDLQDSESKTWYIDLQLQEGKAETGLMLGPLLNTVYQLAKESDNETMIVIDESHYLTKEAENLTFLEQVIRHSRHYDISVGFSTQSVSEFFETNDDGKLGFSNSGQQIFNNLAVLSFMHLDEMSDGIAGAIGLNHEEAHYVRNAQPGDEERGFSEALLAVDEDGERERYPMRVEMHWEQNPHEFAICDYEPSKDGPWHDYLQTKLNDRYDENGELDQIAISSETDDDDDEIDETAPDAVLATDGGDDE